MMVVAIVAGCDRGSDDDGRPTTAPAAATAPSTMPASAILQIGNQPITFAAPTAQFQRDGDTLRLLIYSNKDDDINSFYFEVPIEPDASPNDPIDFEQELPPVQTEESLVGIDLGQSTLQPRKLKIVARPTGGVLKVEITGEFVSGDEATQSTAVSGQFAAGIRN